MSEFVTKLSVRNFTAFAGARLEFAPGLNVFVGENATGKTHLLKLLYCALAANGPEREPISNGSALEERLSRKLASVFQPDRLGRLVRHVNPGMPPAASVVLEFNRDNLNVEFSLTSTAERATVSREPRARLAADPAFLPTRELLSLGPAFISLYDLRETTFEETWRNTLALIYRPLLKGRRADAVRRIVEPIARAIGGELAIDSGSGKLYFHQSIPHGSEGAISLQAVDPADSAVGWTWIEIPPLAEGLRKLASVEFLVANGTLLERGFLLWDEPESNLNPVLIRAATAAILSLADSGIQVFLATHSLFLLRELELGLGKPGGHVAHRFFGLHRSNGGGVEVMQSDSMNGIGDIVALDEEIRQSDEYLGVK